MRTIRDCNVAVVGGAGFLGSHLVNHLIEDRGCKVLVVDNLVVGRSEFIHPRAAFLHHDITGSEDYLRREFQEFQMTDSTHRGTRFVFNYAAYPYIPDSFARPVHVFNVNAFGALKVINAAQEAGAEAILQVSSAEIYGERDITSCSGNDGGRIGEENSVVPHSTYGASKAAIDGLVQARWREGKTPCIALRQFNCVGERETHPYIVPEILSQLYRQTHLAEGYIGCDGRTRYQWGGPVQIRLGNNSFRDFLYAGDAVKIAVELLERGQFGEVYNLGSETGIKMYDLARLIGKLVGAQVEVIPDPARVRPWEIWHLQSDNSKLWSLFPSADYARNWLTPLDEALRRTIIWFEDHNCKWPWEK